jgi:hypothetical protein
MFFRGNLDNVTGFPPLAKVGAKQFPTTFNSKGIAEKSRFGEYKATMARLVETAEVNDIELPVVGDLTLTLDTVHRLLEQLLPLWGRPASFKQSWRTHNNKRAKCETEEGTT